ncbi:hypothetical protein [Arthrobacter sp. PAMC 25486]|uniref:hypothetical protein n=2 Tax=Arthrobacter TaxID=1663 RepID=UPI000570CEF9|nr:hypothetical protein [Arthrobacter sp. PAMC 25486]
MFGPLAVGSVAASSTPSFSLQPFFVLVIMGVILISSFVRAANRKKRSQQASTHVGTPAHPVAGSPSGANPAGRQGVAHQASGTPYVGTLLNGVPLQNYDNSHGHQTTGFANERMRAEAELKRQLDALDAARRAGQVTAEQYATHREAIFKNF